MRIIGGEWGGRRIEVPADIRPMQDRERQRLFDILAGRVEGAAFLDIFAGSGAIGIEALSRGARFCTFVENGHKVLPVLRRNLESLGAGERGRVLPISAFALPRSGEPGPGTVDIAVCAPPFPLLRDPSLRPRLETLFLYVATTLVRQGGVFVLEHPSDMEPPLLGGASPPEDTRPTAGSALSLYCCPPAPPPNSLKSSDSPRR